MGKTEQTTDHQRSGSIPCTTTIVCSLRNGDSYALCDLYCVSLTRKTPPHPLSYLTRLAAVHWFMCYSVLCDTNLWYRLVVEPWQGRKPTQRDEPIFTNLNVNSEK